MKTYSYEINHPLVKGTLISSHASIFKLLEELSNINYAHVQENNDTN